MLSIRAFLTALLIVLFCLAGQAHKILVEDSWPPFAFKKDNFPVGLSVDLVSEAFFQAGEPLELVQVPYPRCIALTANGKYPACFNSAYSAEMKEFLFPKEPLFKSRGLIVFNIQKKENHVHSLKDLEGKQVALPTGFPFGTAFDENKKILKVFTANDFNSLRMVHTQRISFAAVDEFVLYYYLKHHPEFRKTLRITLHLSEEPIFVHFAKNSEGKVLLRKFETGLIKLKKSARYKEILEKWVGKEGLNKVALKSPRQ
ncbi:substrate-binding periplasmic protein [Bdellovibrio bacteriovorus]|uniref:substrate-binding periplasmic protein n=1 Tax=Bdellovibrio bacteriovorus TaxID=959 RepID=UPI0035A5F04C